VATLGTSHRLLAALLAGALSACASPVREEPALGERGSDPFGRYEKTREQRREQAKTATPAPPQPAPTPPAPTQPAQAAEAPAEPAVVARVPDPAASIPAPRPTGYGAAPGVDFGRYRALVIGNNAYQHFPQLETAGRDAENVAKLLREAYGFEVEVIREATHQDLMGALSRQRRELEEADNLLIYYAGHGWNDEDAKEAYWLPVDARPDDQTAWISNSTITQMIRAMRARHVLVVADSCYSGTLTRGISIQPSDSQRLSRLVSRRSRTALTSGGNEPVVDGGGSGHSVFASALLRALSENQAVIDATELYVELRRRVMLDAQQTPQYGDIRMAGHEDGDFFFVPRRPGERR
jgi:hypothetical protein